MKIVLQNTNLVFRKGAELVVLSEGTQAQSGSQTGAYFVLNVSLQANKTYYIKNTNETVGYGKLSPEAVTLNSSKISDIKETLTLEGNVTAGAARAFTPTQDANYVRFYAQFQSGDGIGYQLYTYE